MTRGERAHPMDSFDATGLGVIGLGERSLAAGTGEPAIALDEPPPILVEAPSGVDPKQSVVNLTIRLGSPDLKDVRLYHNDAPIGTRLEETPDRPVDGDPPPGRITVPVRLVEGDNE